MRHFGWISRTTNTVEPKRRARHPLAALWMLLAVVVAVVAPVPLGDASAARVITGCDASDDPEDIDVLVLLYEHND